MASAADAPPEIPVMGEEIPVLAIGDSDNDIPMLRAAGFGIAMGNAAPHVKAVARWVAPAIEEDGAAVALQRWILDA